VLVAQETGLLDRKVYDAASGEVGMAPEPEPESTKIT
jgi:hypothetical protein